MKKRKAPKRAASVLFCNRVCKPGSVLDSHLSCRAVADTLHATSRRRPGRPCVSSTVLLRIEFTAPDSLQPASELLPHFSTLAPPEGAGRFLSVALFLKSPSAGVTRYPCPVEPGLSSRWAFRPSRAAVRPGCRGILARFSGKVNGFFCAEVGKRKSSGAPCARQCPRNEPDGNGFFAALRMMYGGTDV